MPGDGSSVMVGGQERTEDQYAALMREADLRLTRVLPTNSIFQLIEGAPL